MENEEEYNPKKYSIKLSGTVKKEKQMKQVNIVKKM
jgi:hypothetical protein